MRPRSAAVVVLPLLLQACLASATPDRTNDYQNQSPEVRPRGHDTAERPLSGRRWTTSRNSPYQKIVSSYEQEVPAEEKDDTDQAKAKSSKRKLLRTNAPSHDQIASETSADEGSEKIESDINVSGTEESQGEKKPTTLISRRRSSGGIIRDISSEQLVEPSTANPKKRRRVVSTTSTTTLAPQTMSDSLYQYFRPLDRDVPQDDIIPFLDFGRKLSPVIPTTSSANSIDSKSMVTKLRPRNHYEDKDSHSSDEEMLQEDMDVTVVKKAIERNSVPRGKLRLREQGISDYYRKRVPVQVRTTENLISTSDSSTASSVPSAKNIGVLKKINRHQISHSQPVKSSEEQVADHYSSSEDSQSVPYIEVVQDKRRQYLRPVQRLAAIKQEHSHSPLTAESTLVKTIIKELPNVESSTNNHETVKLIISTTTTVGEPKLSNSEPSSTNTPEINASTQSLIKQTVPNVVQKSSSEVASVVVANSEHVQDSLENPQIHSTTENLRQGTPSTEKTISPLPLSLSVSNQTSDSKTLETESSTYTSSAVTKSSTSPTSTLRSVSEFKLPTVKTDIPLRSRDIYKPKTIPPGSLIPHLPRTIPLSNPLGNSTPKSRSPPPPTSTEKIIQETPTATTLSSTTTTTTSKTSSTTTSTVKSSPTTDTTTQQTANITIKPTLIPTTVSPELQSKEMTTTTKEVIRPGDLYRSKNNDQVSTQVTATPNEEKSASSTMKTPIKEDEEHSLEKDTTHSNRGDVIKHEEESSQGVEADSLPPLQNEEPTESLVIIPVFSPDDKTDHEDLYPVYYTIPPTSRVPVVDTRPDTEAEVVEETNVTLPVSSTTNRPGQEWVKLGAIEKEVEVVYSEPMGLGAYVLAALGVVPVLIGALIGARFIMTHNKKKVLDESEYSSEYNRSPLSITSTPLPTKLPRIPTHVSWSETEKSPLASGPAPGTSPSGRWEFPREKLRLQTLLGQGNFGQVWKAEADDIAGHEGLTRLVAVKTVKECANAREREDLLRELGIMQELGSHPNVVTLLGCCTEKEPIYVVMEYVMYGKLLSFLRDHRTRAHYYNFSDATDALTSRDLTVFAYCVARGMDYLTNKSIIHRDIAARNVLVDHNKLCKIADFGMSRNVRDTGQIYEQRQSKGALPIRWMASESLHFSLFTHKTDVWSFGILMWEIVTLGSTPYATMGAREVMRRVRDGYRLERPTHCRAELFRVIAQCWHSEPSKRPSFAELKAELAQLLSDSEHRGCFVDLDSYADQMRRDTLHRH